MNNPILLFLFLLCSYCAVTTQQLETSSNPTNFIQKSCNTTLYPTLCFKCLFNYSNLIKPPNQAQKLAQISLQLSLSRAQSVSRFITKLSNFSGSKSSRPNQALKDCFDLLGSSVDELSQSLKELNGLSQSSVANNPNNPNFSWHMSNCRTWVSAALTNDFTCIDGFSEQSSNIDKNIMANIKAKVRNVAQVTSIALAFITHFAEGNQGVTPMNN